MTQTDKKEVFQVTMTTGTQFTGSQPTNYKAVPPRHAVITANRLFSLFTADIIREDKIFTR